jgi:hypothetical protein
MGEMVDGFPSRYCNREDARREFGPDADRYASYYYVGDPVADGLAAWMQRRGEPAKAQFERALKHGLSSVSEPSVELQGFFERAEQIPTWVDFAELREGALAYQRFGILGMIVLSAWSLINGYHSSAAVKPLAFTGQLRHNAQQRLAETARFVSEASQVDGLRCGHPGYEISLRVALIHAHVRSACARAPGWRTQDWGVPINQADMLGTLLEFSLLMIDGAQRLGFHVSSREKHAILAMWRYCGHLNGVDPWLLSHLRTEGETRHIAELIRLVQPGPDEDSLALTRQLLKVPKQNARGAGPGVVGVAVSRFHNGLARALNGPEIADNLGIPNDFWKYAEYPVRAVLTPLERLRRIIPGASHLVAHASNTIIRKDLQRILRASGAELSTG